MPTKILDLELSKELVPIWGIEGYDGLWVLVRYHGQPVGWVWLSIPNSGKAAISTEQLQQAIAEQLGWELVQSMFAKQLSNENADNHPSEPISIVVCTRDRTEQLEGCLKALLAIDYPTYEIIVVDNAPNDDATAKLAATLPVRYVREDRPGLNWARNRGIAEAGHSIVAFTDDDVRVDCFWLNAIAKAFSEPDVMAVTGLVAPSKLETTAQMIFEFGCGGMGHGFHRRTFRRDKLTEQELLWANKFGVGANMAFRRDLFTKIGLFDVALDAGTPSQGGGDLEMFHRLVAREYTLVYDPAMLVWHTHKPDISSLYRQLYDRGRSFGSYLLTCARNQSVNPRLLLRFVMYDWLCGRSLRRLVRPGKLPRHLIAIELAGMLLSPASYVAAQKQARQVASIHPEPDSEKHPLREAA